MVFRRNFHVSSDKWGRECLSSVVHNSLGALFLVSRRTLSTQRLVAAMRRVSATNCSRRSIGVQREREQVWETRTDFALPRARFLCQSRSRTRCAHRTRKTVRAEKLYYMSLFRSLSYFSRCKNVHQLERELVSLSQLEYIVRRTVLKRAVSN